jgi:hypothetical protein
MRLSVAEPENKFLNTFLSLLSYERYHNSNSFGYLGMAIITLRVSAGIQGTRAAFQWLRHFKNIFCSRLHYGNKTLKMKQTAVEWLIDELTDNGIDYLDLAYEIIEKAKEMEKQQIVDACNYGDFKELGKKYYNETYKKP